MDYNKIDGMKSIDRKLIIVECCNQIMTAVYEDDTLVEFLFDKKIDSNDKDKASLVDGAVNIDGSAAAGSNGSTGSIYVGKVKNIVKNINAAFVEIEGGQYGYYSLADNTNHLYTTCKKNGGKMVPGDELIVQMKKEAMKTKLPMLDSHLSFSGQYLVLTVNKSFVGISEKIEDRSERRRLKAAVEPLVTAEYGFIIRTAAKGQSEETLLQEARWLEDEYRHVLEKGRYARCFTKIYSGMPAFIRYIQSNPGISKITTDVKSVYDYLSERLQASGSHIPAVFYEDEQWPLAKLKSLETQLSRALSPKVWLKSGGFLVIEQTEAMVVIDVNTGKYTGKKNAQETFLKINLEAAEEIGRQLRLRNLSGIIIIDFIDMEDAQMRRRLWESFEAVLKRDPVKTVLVEMTRLNLIEMTRQKERRPLHEYLGCQCPGCHGSRYIYKIQF